MSGVMATFVAEEVLLAPSGTLVILWNGRGGAEKAGKEEGGEGQRRQGGVEGGKEERRGGEKRREWDVKLHSAVSSSPL